MTSTPPAADRPPGRGAVATPARLAARAMLRSAPDGAEPGRLPVRATSRRLRAVVAWDGSGFAGWQRQRDVVSVQELLEAAIEKATGLPATVAASGRTDAGVHAEGQVVAFDSATGLPPRAIRHICDHLLPSALRVLVVDDAPAGFDPQRECVRKLYRYLIRVVPAGVPASRAPGLAPAWSGIAWCLPGPIDVRAMADAAARLTGKHDFRAFRSDPGPDRRGEDTVRTIERLAVDAALGLVRVEAEGPGFLYMMVRNLTAALAEVGLGRRSPAWVSDVLASRDRRRLPPPAPACGLTLVRVTYDPPWPQPADDSTPAGFPEGPAKE